MNGFTFFSMLPDSKLRAVDLIILGLSDLSEEALTVNIVKRAFLKLAIVKHPDKAGGSTAAFQELLDSYERTLDHINVNQKKANLDDDEQFVKDLFNKFNFPRENDHSFTIIIENHLAEIWEEELSEIYNDPVINAANHGRQWKTMYNYEGSTAKITVTLWNTPKSNNQSKILIQGGKQSLNTIFVFNELSSIYTKVRLRSKSRPKSISEAPAKSNECEHCEYISQSKSEIELHMKSNHAEDNRENASVLTDRISLKQLVEKTHRIKCDGCDKGFENEKYLENHRSTDHPGYKCDSCDVTVRSEDDLRKHIIEKHNVDLLTNCHDCKLQLKLSDLKLKCDHCEFVFHKKCTEFKSKPGQWNEPNKWQCKYCAKKEDSESSNTDLLNPNAVTFVPPITNQPQFSGKHRKSKVNTESPETEFLQTTVDILKVTIAKNDLEIKKLKESNDLKAKRIINLESQVEEARNTISKHQCNTLKEPSANIQQSGSVTIDGFQQVKIATLENRTNTIEQNMTLLTSRLENLQFNFLAANKVSDKPSVDKCTKPDVEKIYLCDVCDFQTSDKVSLKKHKESKHKTKSSHQRCQDELSCKQCSYIAAHFKDLKRHELQMHCSDEFTADVYSCKECDYSTQYQARLKKHVQSVHEKSRYFYSSSRKKETQPIGGKSPTQSGDSFSDDPLPCNSCDFKTKSVAELRNHKDDHQKKKNTKSTHPFSKPVDTPSPPVFNGDDVHSMEDSEFKCDKCDKVLCHKDEFALHMQFFHSHTSKSHPQ